MTKLLSDEDPTIAERYYNNSLKEVHDLGWYVDIVNELDTLSKEGRINDMRRLLVVRNVDLITADRKRVALEARIDELSAIYGWSSEERTPLIFYPEHRSSDFAQMAANGMGTNFTVRERIAELKAQQEEV